MELEREGKLVVGLAGQVPFLFSFSHAVVPDQRFFLFFHQSILICISYLFT